MRGTVDIYKKLRNGKRITPAHAGNRIFCVFRKDRFRDHPRTCGEQFLKVYKKALVIGSPPHMRGTDHGIVFPPPNTGITPAHAGNSAE